MGLDEGVLAMLIILVMVGLLPLAMAWLERRWLRDEEKVITPRR